MASPAVEREEIQRLIETILPQHLPMLDRIVRWRSHPNHGWDPVAIVLRQIDPGNTVQKPKSRTVSPGHAGHTSDSCGSASARVPVTSIMSNNSRHKSPAYGGVSARRRTTRYAAQGTL